MPFSVLVVESNGYKHLHCRYLYNKQINQSTNYADYKGRLLSSRMSSIPSAAIILFAVVVSSHALELWLA